MSHSFWSFWASAIFANSISNFNPKWDFRLMFRRSIMYVSLAKMQEGSKYITLRTSLHCTTYLINTHSNCMLSKFSSLYLYVEKKFKWRNGKLQYQIKKDFFLYIKNVCRLNSVNLKHIFSISYFYNFGFSAMDLGQKISHINHSWQKRLRFRL